MQNKIKIKKHTNYGRKHHRSRLNFSSFNIFHMFLGSHLNQILGLNMTLKSCICNSVKHDKKQVNITSKEESNDAKAAYATWT